MVSPKPKRLGSSDNCVVEFGLQAAGNPVTARVLRRGSIPFHLSGGPIKHFKPYHAASETPEEASSCGLFCFLGVSSRIRKQHPSAWFLGVYPGRPNSSTDRTGGRREPPHAVTTDGLMATKWAVILVDAIPATNAPPCDTTTFFTQTNHYAYHPDSTQATRVPSSPEAA